MHIIQSFQIKHSDKKKANDSDKNNGIQTELNIEPSIN